ELCANVVLPGAHSFADTNFFGALSDRDQHDVHDYNTADHQRNRRHADRHEINIRSCARIKIQKNILGLQSEAVIFVLESPSPAIAHNGAYLIFGGFELGRGLSLNQYYQRRLAERTF